MFLVRLAAAFAVVAFPAAALFPPAPTPTPAGTALIGTPVYTIPYAIQRGTPGGFGIPLDPTYVATFVIIGNNASGTACTVQVEWRDGGGALVGVSGPVTIAPEQTRQFTTMHPFYDVFSSPNYTFQPFFNDVMRSVPDEFIGHAKVRSTCPALQRLRVDAIVAMNTDGSPATRHIPVKVTRVPGNVGE